MKDLQLLRERERLSEWLDSIPFHFSIILSVYFKLGRYSMHLFHGEDGALHVLVEHMFLRFRYFLAFSRKSFAVAS